MLNLDNQLGKIGSNCVSKLNRSLQSKKDPSFWALNELHIDLFDNQIDIINDVCDTETRYLAILMSRGSGKSYAVCLGLIKLCLDTPGYKVGVFGPKSDQANRLIKEEITGKIITPTSSVYAEVDWEKTSGSRVTFLNGSSIVALSASETAQQEGFHFHCAVLDECHRISDIVVNQRITPMLGSFSSNKLIKIGISMYRQNFWKSCCDPNTKYKLLKRDWTQCPILLQQGSVHYKGQEYSQYVVDQMPIALKRKMFPDRPDLHYDSVSGLTELDFNTQYAMEWANDVNLVLSAEEQKKLVSGEYDILSQGRPEFTESYFFGLDTAAGSILPGKRDLDWTVLSIWRKTQDNKKEKVFCFEWQGDVLQQIEEIKSIIHPVTGRFKCKFGLADYSNIAITIVETFKKENIPVEGIMFNGAEATTHKNFKNAMVDEFVFELQCGRLTFPKLEKIEADVIFHKSLLEWLAIERHIKTGINHKIEAPADMHDDHCMADVLAVWAADRYDTFKGGLGRVTNIPDPQIGGASVQSRMMPNPNNFNNRYLK